MDINPSGVIHNPEKGIFVFGHHPHSSHPWEPESKEKWRRFHTATSKLIQFLSLDLDDPKVTDLIRWAYRGDFARGDNMNIAKILQEMNLCFIDEEVQQWFSPLFEAHFKVQKFETEKGIDFFMKVIKRFLSENENTPAKATLERWLEKAQKVEDRMNIAYRTAANLAVFGSQSTEEWLRMVLQGIEKGQQLFKEAASDFEEAEKMVVGQVVLVITETNNPRFGRLCRSEVARELMPSAMKRATPIVVQFQPLLKGFQIFSPRKGFNLDDLAGAIRTKILEVRGLTVPTDWRVLKAEGTLNGTEPLYYHRALYSVLLWGSLTRPMVPPLDIPPEEIKRTVIIAADQTYFPSECKESEDCLRRKCPLYQWHLFRCFKLRKNRQVAQDQTLNRGQYFSSNFNYRRRNRKGF
ncbi:MAG: hypothetical protein ACE5J0_00455 [Candidatus Paceibacterales bacterium]